MHNGFVAVCSVVICVVC